MLYGFLGKEIASCKRAGLYQVFLQAEFGEIVIWLETEWNAEKRKLRVWLWTDEIPEGCTARCERRHQQRKKCGLLCSPFLTSVTISWNLCILDKILTLHSNRALTVFIPKGRVISMRENSKPGKQDILEVICTRHPVDTMLLYRLLLFSIYTRHKISMSQNIRPKHENMYVSIS